MEQAEQVLRVQAQVELEQPVACWQESLVRAQQGQEQPGPAVVDTEHRRRLRPHQPQWSSIAEARRPLPLRTMER